MIKTSLIEPVPIEMGLKSNKPANIFILPQISDQVQVSYDLTTCEASMMIRIAGADQCICMYEPGFDEADTLSEESLYHASSTRGSNN